MVLCSIEGPDGDERQEEAFRFLLLGTGDDVRGGARRFVGPGVAGSA
ncbi:MAG: hypothetical protein AAGF11_44820 [Myxococcota bacterium]